MVDRCSATFFLFVVHTGTLMIKRFLNYNNNESLRILFVFIQGIGLIINHYCSRSKILEYEKKEEKGC